MDKKTLDETTQAMREYWDKYLPHNIPHFVGGSRRFGYEHETSDLDIFVFTPEQFVAGRAVKARLIDALKIHGFKRIYGDEAYRLGEGTEVWRLMSNHDFHTGRPTHTMDMVLMTNGRQWSRYKEEHELLEKSINDNPELRDFARAMHDVGIKGTLVYKTLKRLCV